MLCSPDANSRLGRVISGLGAATISVCEMSFFLNRSSACLRSCSAFSTAAFCWPLSASRGADRRLLLLEQSFVGIGPDLQQQIALFHFLPVLHRQAR